jgi:hypothetical protein
MATLSAIKNPDAWAAGFIAPTSKGMSQGKAVEQLTQIFQTYANQDAWNTVKKDPVKRAKLAELAPAIVDALERNGYDSNKAIDSAKGVVLGRLYTRVWEALNDKDYKEIERLSLAVLRVGGSLQGLKQSVKQKGKTFRSEVTPEMQQAMATAFGEEMPTELAPPKTVAKPRGVEAPPAPTATEKAEQRLARLEAAEKARAAKIDAEVKAKLETAKKVYALRYGVEPTNETEWEKALKLTGTKDSTVRAALNLK